MVGTPGVPHEIDRSAPALGVVIPCYNEDQVLEECARRVSRLLQELIAGGLIAPHSFIYFVDDGSVDSTWQIIEGLHRSEDLFKGLKLARNVGHQNALLAGLLSVAERVDCSITLDADLQHDERAIPAFLEHYRRGAEIVYGVRSDRAVDSSVKKYTALLFYRLMGFLGVKLIKNHADYRLISRKALLAIAEYKEVNVFLRGIVLDIGLPSAVVPFVVRKRLAGTSKYSFTRMLGFALDGVTSFSVVPLRIATLLGAIIFVFSFGMSLFVLFNFLRANVIPGWASTVIPIYFLGGIQIMLMGLIGEYIGKIYKETKARPRFIKDVELF